MPRKKRQPNSTPNHRGGGAKDLRDSPRPPPIVERVPPQLVPSRAHASAAPVTSAVLESSAPASSPTITAPDSSRSPSIAELRPPQLEPAIAPASVVTTTSAGVSTEIFPITAEAFEILKHKDVVISYSDKQGSLTRRTIVPRRLTTEHGYPAITAFCRLRGDERTFLLKRIRSAASSEWPSALELTV